MTRLVIAPIVEGHGEENAIRTLLEGIWWKLLKRAEHLEVCRPIRAKRGKLVKPNELHRLLRFSSLKLKSQEGGDPQLILLLFDADTDCPAELSRNLREIIHKDSPAVPTAIVIANVEYETWFVAAAESLTNYLDLQPGDPPEDPEGARAGKKWIDSRFKGVRYSPSVDQPALSASMDLALCRRRSASFDKLCRELERFRYP